MSDTGPAQSIDAAFERIEETILPSLGMMLDTLIEAAALARPGIDGDAYAAELRMLALQLEELTRQVEAASPGRFVASDQAVGAAA